MTTLAHRIVRQRGFVLAAVTAAVVFTVLLLQNVLGSVLGTLILLMNGAPVADYAEGIRLSFLLHAAGAILPFSVGMLLSLWFIAPVAAELRLFHVITRSVLAAVIGAVFAIIVTSLLGFIGSIGFEGALFANSFPRASFDGNSAVFAIASGLQLGVQYIVSATPLVILSGVLLWIWLTRHPTEHSVSGMLDAV